MVNAVVDDSTKLVHSNQRILKQSELDYDRLVEAVVLGNRKATAHEAGLRELEDEYNAILHITASRVKMALLADTDQGVDAFDVAKLLTRAADELVRVRPLNVLRRRWARGNQLGPPPQEEAGAAPSTGKGSGTDDDEDEADDDKNKGDRVAVSLLEQRRRRKWEKRRKKQLSTTLYEETRESSKRRVAKVMAGLASEMDAAKFVHEFGRGGGADSDAVGAAAGAATGGGLTEILREVTEGSGAGGHSVGKASRRIGGTSAAHEMMKLGIDILSDMLDTEQETQDIAAFLVRSKMQQQAQQEREDDLLRLVAQQAQNRSRKSSAMFEFKGPQAP